MSYKDHGCAIKKRLKQCRSGSRKMMIQGGGSGDGERWSDSECIVSGTNEIL